MSIAKTISDTIKGIPGTRSPKWASVRKAFLKDNATCAICKKHKSNFTRALAVDHCHTTGKIRGLLCTNCNRALGNIKDSIDNLKNAIEYLEL